MLRCRIAIPLVLAFLHAAPAIACTCIERPNPPCQALFQADAVFVGTVQSVKPVKLEDRPFETRLVHFSMENPVRGVQGAIVDILTGQGGGDCGFDFKPGLKYVVYAYRRQDGSLLTGICSRTRLATEADDDLRYFASMPATAAGGSVFGTIFHREPDEWAGRTRREPIASVMAVVRGEHGVFSAISDEDGRYRIERVPPGTYEFEPLPPAEYSTRHQQRTIELRDSRACVAVDVFLQHDGRISGTVLDADGRPVADIKVELVASARLDEPLHPLPQSARTDESGRFEIVEVPPGQYVVGVGLTRPAEDPKVAYPRTFHPGATRPDKAVPVSVEPGGGVELAPLRLAPALRSYELTGVVVTADGAPQPEAEVVLQDPRGNQVSTLVRTDSSGRFTFRVFADLPYVVRAWYAVERTPNWRQVSATLSLGILKGPPDHVRLILTSTR